MKSMIPAALAAVLLLAGNAQAATQTAQQSRMVTCNKQAGAKKGDERATSMKHCLASKTSATGTHRHKKSSAKGTHTHKKTTHTASTSAATTAPSAADTMPDTATAPTAQ